jgi:hypothetical protein
MNKVHGKTNFTQNGLSIHKLWQEACFFVKNGQLLSLLGTRGKNFSFPILVVNFWETFCKCSPSSLGQDLTIKNANFYFLSFGLLSKKWQFWMFFEKKGFYPLEVRRWICVFLIFFYIFFLFRWVMKQWVRLPFWFSKIWLPLYSVFSAPINFWKVFALCFTTQVGL